MRSWVDAVGWAGAVLLLAAYVAVATRRLTGHGAAFHGLNLLGSAGLAANSAASGAFPSVALNLVWMAVGLVAVVRGRARRTPAPRTP
jgi:hypothetical protein